MKYNVYVISDAEKDLFEIYDYIKKSGYPGNTSATEFEIRRTDFYSCNK